MYFVFLWYVVISLLGWLTFPLAYRLMPGLADRGYTISRTIGLLLWGYLFWLLASLGVLHNDVGGHLFALVILIALSLWSARSIGLQELRAWFQSHIRWVVGIEFLFLAAFVGWAFVRSANPEALGTEKPMELAFINAILNSKTFPPHDPWLSGYAISYYYFGYVLVAMLAKFTGASGAYAFNLGIALVFALSALGSYGMVFNLLNWRSVSDFLPKSWRFSLAALLGPLFVLFVSNLEGFLQMLHNRGLFWRLDVTEAGGWSSPFWQWLDIKDLNLPPIEPFSWIPDKFWWWWRASRVLQDYDYAGNWREIIDEFPFFSYLLADLHPHVLAMPFAFLAMVIALNILISGGGGKIEWLHNHLHLPVINLSPAVFLSSAIILGAMAFLNTWDLPVYVGLFAAAYLLRRMQAESKGIGSALGEFLWISLVLGIAAFLLYLPFYMGFSSQAGGIIPNLIYITRGAHLWVMFAPLLFPLFIFLFHQISENKQSLKASFKPALLTTLALAIGLWLFSLILGFSATLLPGLGSLYLNSLSAPNGAALISEAFFRRLVTPGAWLTLSLLLFLVLRLLLSNLHPIPQSTLFTLLLVILGTLLVFVPEFFFLRDQFGWRMNTIFKFYFQAWLLWSVAAAYYSIILWNELHSPWSWLFRSGLILLLLMSLVYPLFSLVSKTDGFQVSPKTLDSTAYLEKTSPDDMAAIRWLSEAPFGVVAEAVPPGGGSYTEYARASTLSGKPSVLGWAGHESQWRGGYAEMGSRQSDLERLYCGRDSEEILSILDQYDIRYIYVGPLERATYTPNTSNCPSGLFETKFQRFLKPAFSQGAVTIYEYIR